MKLNKAISPILATVIIIAVTLVIAVGVVGWIMGIWGSFGSTEQLQIYPDSKLYATDKHLTLHIKNGGTATSQITRIEIVGTGCYNDTTFTLPAGADGYLDPSAGKTTSSPVNITLGGSCSLTAGATYQVKVYTTAGNVYSTVITAS